MKYEERWSHLWGANSCSKLTLPCEFKIAFQQRSARKRASEWLCPSWCPSTPQLLTPNSPNNLISRLHFSRNKIKVSKCKTKSPNNLKSILHYHRWLPMFGHAWLVRVLGVPKQQFWHHFWHCIGGNTPILAPLLAPLLCQKWCQNWFDTSL